MNAAAKIFAVFAIILAAVSIWEGISTNTPTMNLGDMIVSLIDSVMSSVVGIVVWLLWMLATIITTVVISLLPGDHTPPEIPQPEILNC